MSEDEKNKNEFTSPRLCVSRIGSTNVLVYLGHWFISLFESRIMDLSLCVKLVLMIFMPRLQELIMLRLKVTSS